LFAREPLEQNALVIGEGPKPFEAVERQIDRRGEQSSGLLPSLAGKSRRDGSACRRLLGVQTRLARSAERSS
jgi:hypothetical protein